MANQISKILKILDGVKNPNHPLNKDAVAVIENSITSSLQLVQQMFKLQDIVTVISANAHNLNSPVFNSLENLQRDVVNITSTDTLFYLSQEGSI
ncbi:hypothetical protein GEMRC1_010011 [Eukaryota sp. GEM-RC1]